MDKDVRERFERIEANLERMTERMDTLLDAHIDLEAAQKNTTVQLNAFIEEARESKRVFDERLKDLQEDAGKRGKDIDERIANLTILVDRLVARDLDR